MATDPREMGGKELVRAYGIALARDFHEAERLRDELLRRLSAGNPQAESERCWHYFTCRNVPGKHARCCPLYEAEEVQITTENQTWGALAERYDVVHNSAAESYLRVPVRRRVQITPEELDAKQGWTPPSECPHDGPGGRLHVCCAALIRQREHPIDSLPWRQPERSDGRIQGKECVCGEEETASGGDVHCSGDCDDAFHNEPGGCHRTAGPAKRRPD